MKPLTYGHKTPFYLFRPTHKDADEEGKIYFASGDAKRSYIKIGLKKGGRREEN